MHKNIKDITGNKHNRLLVLEYSYVKQGSVYWKCLCDCGNTTLVRGTALRNGQTKSCGCLQKEIVSKVHTIDLTGQTFSRIKVVEYNYTSKDRCAWWRCICDCGNEVIIRGRNLRNGQTKSCGCLQREVVQKLGRTSNLIHGEGGKTKLNKIWRDMKHRCKNILSKRYGGRGISICDEWVEFISFRDWALSNGYRKGLSIDRIDNDGNYCPENCQWITKIDNIRKGNSNINYYTKSPEPQTTMFDTYRMRAIEKEETK